MGCVEKVKCMQESEDRVKNLLVNLYVGVVVFSSRGDILICNRRFIEITRDKNLTEQEQLYIEQSILKKYAIENLHTSPIDYVITYYVNEDGQKLTREELPVMKAIKTGKPVNNYIIGVTNTNNSDTRWLLGNREPEFDGDGKVSKVIVTVLDITRRINAEKALKESENRLSAFLKVMPDMYFILAKNGTITDTYLENTNLPLNIQEKYLGLNIKDIEFINKQGDDNVFNCINKLFSTEEIQTTEFNYMKFDGTKAFFEARFTMYGLDTALVVVRYITSRKEYERSFTIRVYMI